MNTPDPSTNEPRRTKSGALACHATNKKGEPCGAPAILGGKVCRTHGGSAPQVKRAAQLRLAALVDPAITVLEDQMENGENGRDKQAAANSVLDRAGYGRTQNVNVEDARDMLLQRLLEAHGVPDDETP